MLSHCDSAAWCESVWAQCYIAAQSGHHIKHTYTCRFMCCILLGKQHQLILSSCLKIAIEIWLTYLPPSPSHTHKHTCCVYSHCVGMFLEWPQRLHWSCLCSASESVTSIHPASFCDCQSIGICRITSSHFSKQRLCWHLVAEGVCLTLRSSRIDIRLWLISVIQTFQMVADPQNK